MTISPRLNSACTSAAGLASIFSAKSDQRRTAGQPDGLAVAVRQPHATDDRRLHVLVFGAFRPLRLATTLGCAAGTTERACGATALTGTTTAAAGTTAVAAATACGCATAARPPPGRRCGSYRRRRHLGDHRHLRRRGRDRRGRTRAAAGPGRDRAWARARRPGRHVARRGAGTRTAAAGPRSAPGRGACGRGIGRSTGCADENGLLPTRGVRGAAWGLASPGRGPGVGRGTLRVRGRCRRWRGGCRRCGAAGARAAGAGAGAAPGLPGLPAPAGGAAGLGAASGAGALAGDLLGGRAVTVGLAPCPPAGFAPPKDSRSRRATGASTVEDADLTNSPCSLSRARTSLLVTPSSLANSCTRALPATTLLSRGDSGGGPRLGFSYDAWSSSDFTVCSCSSLPVLLPGAEALRMPRITPPPRMCPVNR